MELIKDIIKVDNRIDFGKFQTFIETEAVVPDKKSDVYEIIKKEGKTAIMVTHDLGEAITMSKRVIVLSSRPATIKDDVRILFERDYLTPFDKRKEKEYNEYFKKLWGELENANE